jgi:Methyltransferase domain
MSTFANAALLNAAVRQMREEHAYVNVGLWNGFTLLAGMVGNPGQRCIGIDNFSEFGAPREALSERFEARRTPLHQIRDMSYEDYFRDVHTGLIGVYMYDGAHSYEHQRRGLELAEPFFADGCLVFIDDANLPSVRQATLDFANNSPHSYELLLDARTFGNAHPTYWNGLLLLRCRQTAIGPAVEIDPQVRWGSAPAQQSDSADGQAGPDLFHDEPAAEGDTLPTVSLVVCNEGGSEAEVSTAVECALGQTWPALEVIVADASDGGVITEASLGIRGEVAPVVRARSFPAAVEAAVTQTTSRFVGFLEAATPPIPDTAVHLALAYPAFGGFFSGRLKDERRRELERGIQASVDVAKVVGLGASYVLVSTGLGLPQTFRGRRSLRLFQPGERPADVDDATAIERLESFRSRGATYVVLLWSIFTWFASRPLFAAHLDEHDRLIEGSHAMVFHLRG